MKASNLAALRLFKKHVTRILTIVAIVLVSVAFMSGIGETESKIRIGATEHYDRYNLYDLNVKSTSPLGFSSDEMSYFTNKFGEENVEWSLCYEVEKGENETYRVTYLNLDGKINELELLDGAFPSGENEILAERGTVCYDSVSVGDKITIFDITTNVEKTYTVCGIVYNPALIAERDEPGMQYEGKDLTQSYYLPANAYLPVSDAHVLLPDSQRALFDGFSDEYELVIEEYKSEIELALGADSVVVLSLYQNYGMYSMVNYAEKVGLIGIIFVIFFLLVTLLIVYSTMSRLFDEERSQIACQKTLGFGSLKILSRYILFVATATLLGGAIGYPLGLSLTGLLYFTFGEQYRMPPFPSSPAIKFYLITFAIIFAATMLLTLLTGLKITSETPASLLRAKSPKSGKKVLLEKIPFVWNKLSFKYKSTLRNVFLFKSRFLMTVVSVVGSTVLVFSGMGLLDCAYLLDGANSLVLVSIALIVFSAVLCALVIYNLTNINVSERTREIATLMVLGYRDREVTGYIFREIYVMSAIAALLGIPCGIGFVQFVFSLVDFGTLSDVGWWTYVLTPLLTMAFTFVSTLLLRKKITKTDMNASLKAVE